MTRRIYFNGNNQVHLKKKLLTYDNGVQVSTEEIDGISVTHYDLADIGSIEVGEELLMYLTEDNHGREIVPAEPDSIIQWFYTNYKLKNYHAVDRVSFFEFKDKFGFEDGIVGIIGKRKE